MKLLLFCIFHILLQIILVCSSIKSVLLATTFTNESDRLALLTIKDQIHDDPLGALNSSWNNSIHYCEWYGVKCSRRHRHRVAGLALENKKLGVKVLNLQERGASKSFLSECNALKNIRHRNLLKIITSCSSVDFQGNEFKALIFEFMENGSLEEWLSPKRDRHHELRNLNFLQRLNIAIDIASALNYLHNHCEPVVVHCDLKPSNILLDDDMVAHVSDFGLTKMFSDDSDVSSQIQSTSLAIKGTVGYVAPEYGTGGEVSVKGDVSSYGILLLEMFTGKRPTDQMFQDAHDLHYFAEAALPNQVMNIMDPTMPFEAIDVVVYNQNHSDRQGRMAECLASSIRLGVICSTKLPIDCIDIGEAILELYRIKDHYHASIIILE